MTMFKKVFLTLVFGVACTGCVSDPFIDECLANLDAKPLSSEFHLPPAPPVSIPPLAAEALVGKWWVVYTACCRIEDGTHGPFNQISWIQSENYDFSPSGGYHHVQIVEQKGMGGSVLIATIDEHGRWSYENGILMLDVERCEFVTKCNGREVSRRVESDKQKRNCQVEWFADDEMAIKDEWFDNPLFLPQTTNYRTSVNFDRFGTKTIRIVHVTGVQAGRERGSVIEMAYPPVHFKKGEKKD